MPPTPKRSEERRRRNADSKPDKVVVTGAVKAPAADRDWHSSAKRWYNALKKSGQAVYFEPSDWAYAQILAEQLSLALKDARKIERDDEGKVVKDDEGNEVVKFLPLRASFLETILQGMGDLLTTEADRRRMRVEIDRDLGTPEVEGETAAQKMQRELAIVPPTG